MHPTLSNIDYRAFPIFRGFEQDQIRVILSESTVKELEQGATLFEPGQDNDTLYLLIDGELRIIIENDGSKATFPILPGEFVGEMSIVLERPISALGVCHQASTVLLIPERTFWGQVLMTRKGFRNLMATMANRLQRTNHALIQEMEEQLKYKQLEKELETAGKIQSGIVPNGANLLPLAPALDAHAIIKQAREVGGDFYDAALVDEDRIYFAIGDVSGKGMPAALFMMRTISALRMLINNQDAFDKVIPGLNGLLAKNNDDMMFVSLFVGVFNFRTGLLRYVNAGHNPPFVSTNKHGFRPLTTSQGPLVGIFESAQFSVGEIQVRKGNAILLYTDGLSEAMNPDGEMFEMDRIQAVLDQNLHSSAKETIEALDQAVNAFVDTAAPHDDQTVLALKYLG